MKRFLSLLTVLFIFSPIISLSAPNYDPNIKTTVYDVSYNVDLFNRLDKEYDENCHIQITPTLGENICGVNSYGEMVLQKYITLMKKYEELPHYTIDNNQQ